MEQYLAGCIRKAPLLFVVGCVLIVTHSTSGAGVITEQDLDVAVYLPVVSGEEAIQEDIYYLSPNGNDNNSGKTESQAWVTFDRAWHDLYPGDTLILLDGIYYQSLNPNRRNGEPGKPITVRAKNDGKVIIDGEFKRTPVQIGDTWPGPINSYFVVEGVAATNGERKVVRIVNGHHNILRRVSAYNANPNNNSAVISINGSHNLVEDCIAAGTGRKMLYIYKGENNTIRRCYTQWRRWDGKEWHDVWPWGDSIEIYIGANNIIENSISYGPAAEFGINLQAPSESNVAENNRILGSIAIGSGMNQDGTVTEYANIRPQPSEAPIDHVREIYTWASQRKGFSVRGGGTIRNNLWQDIFSWGNVGLGFVNGMRGNYENNVIRRATIRNNGLDAPSVDGGPGTDINYDHLDGLEIVDSYVETIRDKAGTEYDLFNGEGARLQHRYIDGVLMDGTNGQPAQSLWPWPMDDRIQKELGFSLTDVVTHVLVFDELPPISNEAPSVNAGPNLSTSVGEALAISAEVSDDGLPGGFPNPDGSVYYHWMQVSGPALADLELYHSKDTIVSFPQSGQYVLKLIVYDGWISRSDEVSISVDGP